MRLPASFISTSKSIHNYIQLLNRTRPVTFYIWSVFTPFRYAEYTGTQKIHFGIRRAETDASLALISGILSALEIGPLNVYLRDCWENLTTSRAMIFVHYICRRHAIQFLKAKVIEHYGRTSEGSKFFIKWLHAFVICSDLWSMSAKMVSALIVCGTRANVALVQSTINSVSNPTSRTGNGLDISLNCETKRSPNNCLDYILRFGTMENSKVRKCSENPTVLPYVPLRLLCRTIRTYK